MLYDNAMLLICIMCCLSASSEEIKVHCLTWNLAGKSSPDLAITLASAFDERPDVVAFSFQEIARQADISNSATRLDVLKEAVKVAIPDTFVLVSTEKYQSVALFIYFRKDSAFHLAVKQTVTVKHSFGEVTKGKASIAVKVTAAVNGAEKSFFLVSNHLEFSDDRYHYRNDEWKKVMEATKTGNVDYIVMFGDLNYRVELSREDVLSLIEKKDYAALLERDQLCRAQREHPELSGFREGRINFAPTYKFDDASDVYDTSAKQRIPSYTDRVLVMGVTEDKATIMSYKSFHDLLSDHRPVLSTISVSYEGTR